MRALVAYYSFTGKSRLVAASIARELGADMEEIRCARYAPGPWGSIVAGFDSWLGHLPPIEAPTVDVARYDLVIVGGPMWAFHPATPIRRFVKDTAAQLPRVAFFLTHGGSPAARSFDELEGMSGRKSQARLAVREGEIAQKAFQPAIASFAAGLRPRLAA